MMAPKKNLDNSVTNDIIRKVHLTLADIKSGESILNFLRNTEPIFMDEVTRFIRTEIARMESQLTEAQALYIGSVIGASYLAGFLIAREAMHKMFNGLISFKSDINQVLSKEEIDKIIDEKSSEGKSHKEIARLLRTMMAREKKTKKVITKKKDKNLGKRLNLGDLE